MDEVTSALDNRTQNIVSKKFRSTSSHTHCNCTPFKYCENADRIYVLDKGTIIESGTYDELMDKNECLQVWQNDK